MIGDVARLEHHILGHQEDGQVEREGRIARDMRDQDLATLGGKLVDQRGTELRPRFDIRPVIHAVGPDR
jgi:hypothetical protein